MRGPFSSDECETFPGMATLPDLAVSAPIYFKLFKLSHAQKAHFGELFGYRIAKARDLPVPTQTVLCACPTKLLSGPRGKVHEGRDPDAPYVSGIASVELRGAGLHRLKGPDPNLEKELILWGPYPEVAVFDELLMNDDRTIYNLPHLGSGKFALIDHAAVFGGIECTFEQLRRAVAIPCRYNHVADHISAAGNIELKNRMMGIAKEYSREFKITDAILKYDQLDRLCRLPIGTTSDIAELLNKRMRELPELLHKTWIRGQLFQ